MSSRQIPADPLADADDEIEPQDGIHALISHGWKSNDPYRILRALQKGDECQLVQELLFASFAAWIVAPADDDLRQGRILEKLLRITAENESRTKPDRATLTLIWRIYKAIGGSKTLLNKAKLIADLKKKLGTVRRDSKITVEFGLAKHFLFEQGYASLFSINKCQNMIENTVSVLSGTPLRSGAEKLGKRSVGTVWDSHRASLHFVYAAHSLPSKVPDLTLLDIILRDGRSWSDIASDFTMMCMRARHLELGPMNDLIGGKVPGKKRKLFGPYAGPEFFKAVVSDEQEQRFRRVFIDSQR